MLAVLAATELYLLWCWMLQPGLYAAHAYVVRLLAIASALTVIS